VRLSALTSAGILDLGEYLAAKANVIRQQQRQGNEAPIIVQMTNIDKQTDWNDLGEAKTQFLDRHSVDCFPNAISAFKLETNGETMRYFYICAQGITWGPAVGVVTAENDGGGGRMEYLDRHNAECPQGTAMAQFKMNSKNDAEKISYSYNCIAPAVETKMACYDKSTSPTSADGFGFKTLYLDRQIVKCDDNQVLQRFHMVANMPGNSLLYEYRCCNVQELMVTIACEAGKYSTGSGPGKYSVVNGSSSNTTCLMCPAGKYVETSGNDELADCIACGPGKYSVVNGSSSGTMCVGCPVGKYVATFGNDELADCIACAPGKYSLVNGSSSNTTCVGCPAGKYVETSGNDELADCM